MFLLFHYVQQLVIPTPSFLLLYSVLLSHHLFQSAYIENTQGGGTTLRPERREMCKFDAVSLLSQNISLLIKLIILQTCTWCKWI